jgi:DNA-nicking Smr family endonuclease
MKDDDSIYRLLQDLPRFVEKQPAPVEKEGELTAPPPPVMSETDVFTEAMKGVRKLPGGKPRIAAISHLYEPAPTISTNSDRRMLEKTLDESYRFNILNLPEYMEGYSEGINPLTMEKLRNGEFSVQKVLDLHGFGSEEAEVLFEQFLKDSIRSNLRCIRVIHGRGLKSKAGPVLKEKLKGWIMRAMHRKWITGFSSAQMGEGGPGATNILLKKQPTKKSFRIVG